MTKKEFVEMFGEDPEDILGPDWKNLADEYAEEAEQGEQAKEQALEEAQRPRII